VTLSTGPARPAYPAAAVAAAPAPAGRAAGHDAAGQFPAADFADAGRLGACAPGPDPELGR